MTIPFNGSRPGLFQGNRTASLLLAAVSLVVGHPVRLRFQENVMYEPVRVAFDPPRQCKQHGKSWILTCDGEQDVFLPQSQTSLEMDGDAVAAVTVPKFIAEDRGLVVVDVSLEEHNNNTEGMTREDWFTLGITMAMLIRGDDPSAAVWEAGKVVRKLLEEW